MSLLADELTAFLRWSMGTRVTVSRPGTSGYNPDASVVASQVQAVLVPADAREAEVAGEGYAHIPTHQAVVEANEEVRVGYWLTETYYRDEGEAWRAIPTAEQRRFLVLGVERVPGVPEPRNQWRLWLWEQTSRPLGGD